MPWRIRQILLIGSILWLSWMTMMLVHEGGHVVGALCTGGHVRRFVWHPAVLSRTDVDPDPHLFIEVWAGPLLGSLFPLAVAAASSLGRLRVGHLIWVVAGFCLIANGAYIGLGAVDPVGDAKQMLGYGTPRWLMIVFGLFAFVGGLWIWNRVSLKLGFGKQRADISQRDAIGTLVAAILITAAGFIFGDRGF